MLLVVVRGEKREYDVDKERKIKHVTPDLPALVILGLHRHAIRYDYRHVENTSADVHVPHLLKLVVLVNQTL